MTQNMELAQRYATRYNTSLGNAATISSSSNRIKWAKPGVIIVGISDTHQQSGLGDRGAHNRLLTLTPYGRIGEPDDVARAAVWLASDQSDYVVGTTLFVDGGMTLCPGFATNG